MPRERGSDADLGELIELMSEADSAFIGGRMRRYMDLMKHTDDFTLMPPTGGDTIHGFEATDDVITETEGLFKSGDATLEVVPDVCLGRSRSTCCRRATTRRSRRIPDAGLVVEGDAGVST
jgi:hypothetical protein